MQYPRLLILAYLMNSIKIKPKAGGAEQQEMTLDRVSVTDEGEDYKQVKDVFLKLWGIGTLGFYIYIVLE